ncbi:hypothetical protein [Nocardia farcinica]|uniref:hypothetical protein n=1 Tax=Nocardia farcinica TaxID=37329 RepID=UPI0037A42200
MAGASGPTTVVRCFRAGACSDNWRIPWTTERGNFPNLPTAVRRRPDALTSRNGPGMRFVGRDLTTTLMNQRVVDRISVSLMIERVQQD